MCSKTPYLEFSWKSLMLSILFIILTIDDMQDHARWCISYAMVFIEVLRKDQNWAKKLIFLWVFLFMPSNTLWITSQDFAKWKTLLRYISVVKVYWYSICGSKIKNFQSFLYWFSIHEMAPCWVFLVFFTLISPRIVRSWWNFDQR